MVVAVAFVVDRLCLWAAGMGFDAHAIRPRFPADAQWQLLDPRLLQHHLLGSLWELHSQPPLYNLAVGLLLHLPRGAQVPVAALAWSAMGLVLAVTALALLTALRVPPAVAGGVVLVLVVANPDAAMYERWLFYPEPTAATLTVCAYAGVRFVDGGTRRWGALFFGAGAVAVLLNSTYQWVWWLVLAVPAAVALRHRWRSLAVTAAVPVLAVGLWVGKDAVLFGSFTTSSWAGMNLATSTLQEQPAPVLARLVRRGVLSPLAEITPFSPVGAYSPRFFHAPPPGTGPLDERVESNGGTNFDNRVYLAVSQAYLRQDLAFIAAEPGRYATDVARAAMVWALPADDYPFVAGLRQPVAAYATFFDAAVLWQPQAAPRAGLVAEFGRRAPSPAQVSWLTVLVTVLAVAGAPVVAWRARRRDRVLAAGLAMVWWTGTFAFVVTSLFEVGENNRFAAEVFPLPLVAATVTVVATVRALQRRRRARRVAGEGGAGDAGAGGGAGADIAAPCRPGAEGAGGDMPGAAGGPVPPAADHGDPALPLPRWI